MGEEGRKGRERSGMRKGKVQKGERKRGDIFGTTDSQKCPPRNRLS